MNLAHCIKHLACCIKLSVLSVERSVECWVCWAKLAERNAQIDESAKLIKRAKRVELSAKRVELSLLSA